MDMPASTRRTLYPEIQPYETGMLDVGDGHSLYWELSGNPNGKPVVFLHGGPGAGSSEKHRRQFNPDKYKILVFDQRGCGKSKPYAELEANTTWHLVEDIEKLRTEVAKVDKWMVFGGSWGSTLALAYAETHPERVTELVLRGIFLFHQGEVDWMYKAGGASQLFPDKWEDYESVIPEGERDDLVAAYHRRLFGTDQTEQMRAARAWCKWEADIVSLLPNPENVEDFTDQNTAVATARIECQYMINLGWLEDGQLLRDIGRLRGIPGVIVQGRYDCCTPPMAAWQLKQAWPDVELNIVPDASHMYNEPGIIDGLIRATDRFAGA
jgi:proline iminopeptidase